MQENKFIETIDNLKVFGQFEAIKSLRDNLKAAYEHAKNIVGDSDKTNNYDYQENKQETHKPTNPNVSDSYKYKKYNLNWDYIQKYKFILKTENRFLHFREAARILVEIEGKGDEKEWASLLTNSTRNLKRDGDLVKIQLGKSLTTCFWGSPKWLDDNGEPLPEHRYDISFLEKTKPSHKQDDLFDI
tara:strand:+ start:460 stop:1020 length:561 start_codon:yes stop_codon:yes gene_type:complete